MRVALVHDWLTGTRGGEKVLAAIAELFPQADIFTLIHVAGACPQLVRGRKVVTSMLDDLPGVGRYYRRLLPLMPLAMEGMDLSGYDLILSSSHCVAKGVCRRPGSVHVCYCHTPMRYIWHQADQYVGRMGLAGLGLSLVKGYLRAWDVRSARHVDLFLANSHNVARRIEAAYGRTAEVVWPPIDTEFFTPGGRREDFYLVTSALAPYKCVDHAVEALAALGRPLKVVGAGQMERKLRRTAPPNVEFLGWQDDATVRDYYRRCRALLFPGEEDFGMVPVEAMACGTPVIAYGAGGALETVLDLEAPGAAGPTGLLYRQHTPQGLIDAVRKFEEHRSRFAEQALTAWARTFSLANFRARFLAAVTPLLERAGLAVRA